MIHDADATGRALGLLPGQRLTDAAAIHRDLRVERADPEHERRALERLAAWSRRWSPSTRTDGPNGIALDVTGCAHLFGGERAMLADMRTRLEGLGVTACVASAPNHAAAHALVRHAGGHDLVAEADGLEAAVAALPVAALRIDGASITLLHRLGLKTIGQLARLPRPALKKRFGPRRRHRDPRDETWDDYLGRTLDVSGDVLARLDEILSRAPVPFDPDRPVDPPRIMQGLVEPVLDASVVLACAEPLLRRLALLLEGRGEGARVVVLEGFRTDGGRARSVLRLSRPTRDVGHLMRLLVDRLDEWHAEFGFDALAVEAPAVEPLDPSQSDGLERRRVCDMPGLIDRLSNRLGADRVLREAMRESHVPERALVLTPARQAPEPTATPPAGTRPDRLFDQPEEIGVIYALPEGPPARFLWRRMRHDVERVAGPERIAPEWWRERSQVRARDYFSVETREGRRFWIFREGFEGDEREAPVRWFMHGLFS